MGKNKQEIANWEQLLRIVSNDQELTKELDKLYEGIGFCTTKKHIFYLLKINIGGHTLEFDLRVKAR